VSAIPLDTLVGLYEFNSELFKDKEVPKGKGKLDGWLPSAIDNPMKRDFELFALSYTAVWIACFAVVR
jgi:hypothetical protein